MLRIMVVFCIVLIEILFFQKIVFLAHTYIMKEILFSEKIVFLAHTHIMKEILFFEKIGFPHTQLSPIAPLNRRNIV
jgi:hypothetical protein